MVADTLYYPLAESSYHFLMCSSTVKGPRRKTNDYAIGFRSFKQRKGSEHSVFMYSPGYLLSLKGAEGRDTRYSPSIHQINLEAFASSTCLWGHMERQ